MIHVLVGVGRNINIVMGRMFKDEDSLPSSLAQRREALEKISKSINHCKQDSRSCFNKNPVCKIFVTENKA